MRFLAIFLVLVPLGSAALTVEDLKNEMERRDLEHDRELTRLNAVVVELQAQAKQNNTEELEARVTVLEESVSDLEAGFLGLTDDMDNVESANLNQDQRLNIIETDVSDNENDIEDLVGDLEGLEDTTVGLQLRVAEVETNIVILDQRVDDLESGGGGGGGNITGLTERVETLEEVTSQLSGDISELQTTTEDFETRIQELETAVLEPWVACESSPCENGATCVDVNVDTFICTCRDGYFGLTCADSYEDTSFLATFDSLHVTPSDPLVFDYAVLNPGGHYDTTTGIYTVPLDGDYEFTFQIWAYQDEAILAHLKVDDVRVAYGYAFGSNDYPDVETTIMLRLTAGQQVWVEPVADEISGSTEGNGMYSWFSGHLVNAV